MSLFGIVSGALGLVGGLTGGGRSRRPARGGTAFSVFGNPVGANDENLGMWQTARLMEQVGKLTDQEVAFVQRMNPRRFQTIERAVRTLDPNNDRGLVESFDRAAQGSAARQGAISSASLARRGFGQGVQAGAALDAQNRANIATAEYATALQDPNNRANRLMTMAELMGPRNALGMLGQQAGIASQFQGQRDVATARANQRTPTLFDNILGIGSQVLPFFVGQPPKPSNISSFGGDVRQAIQRGSSNLGRLGY